MENNNNKDERKHPGPITDVVEVESKDGVIHIIPRHLLPLYNAREEHKFTFSESHPSYEELREEKEKQKKIDEVSKQEQQDRIEALIEKCKKNTSLPQEKIDNLDELLDEIGICLGDLVCFSNWYVGGGISVSEDGLMEGTRRIYRGIRFPFYLDDLDKFMKDVASLDSDGRNFTEFLQKMKQEISKQVAWIIGDKDGR